MAGMLEDQILKKNIPGRYSSWECENDDLRVEESEKDAGQTEVSEIESCGADDEVPVTVRGGNNTGVKGVLADYNESKRQMAIKQDMDNLERLHALDRQVNGGRLKPGESSMSATALEERRRAQKEVDSQNQSDDSSDNDSDDDDFFSSYRQKRLLQLQSCANWPFFNELVDVTPSQFSESIDKTDPRVHVVCHLYESFIPSCKLLDAHLRQLARVMNYCRFLRLEASSFKSIDPIGLPSILIYRGGKLEANLTPITDHFSDSSKDRFTAEDVRWVLESHGVQDPQSCG